MKRIKSMTIILFVISTTISCHETAVEINSEVDSVKKEEVKKVDINNINKYIFSSESIGGITARTTKTDLNNLYDKKQIKEKIVDSYEGMDIIGTEICFADSSNNFTIQWNETTSTPSIIQISHPKSKWRTRENVKIGSTIKEVQEANGKSFMIYGYEIDEYLAGTIQNWNSGSLQGLNLQFEMTKDISDTEYMKITGDNGIASDNQMLLKAGLVVKNISIYFSQSK